MKAYLNIKLHDNGEQVDIQRQATATDVKKMFAVLVYHLLTEKDADIFTLANIIYEVLDFVEAQGDENNGDEEIYH